MLLIYLLTIFQRKINQRFEKKMTYDEILKDVPKSCIAVAQKRCAKKHLDITVDGNEAIESIYKHVRDVYLAKRDAAKERARLRRNAIPSLIIDSPITSPINIIP